MYPEYPGLHYYDLRTVDPTSPPCVSDTISAPSLLWRASQLGTGLSFSVQAIAE